MAEYAPNLVKKAIVGAGHCEKTQIRMMVGVLLPKADPPSEDAADALAVAICHAHHRSSAVCGQRSNRRNRRARLRVRGCGAPPPPLRGRGGERG